MRPTCRARKSERILSSELQLGFSALTLVLLIQDLSLKFKWSPSFEILYFIVLFVRILVPYASLQFPGQQNMTLLWGLIRRALIIVTNQHFSITIQMSVCTSVQHFEPCPPLGPCMGLSLMSEHMEQRVSMSLCVVSYQKVRRPASHRHVVVSLKKAIAIIIKIQKRKSASLNILLFGAFT